MAQTVDVLAKMRDLRKRIQGAEETEKALRTELNGLRAALRGYLKVAELEGLVLDTPAKAEDPDAEEGSE